MRVPTLLTALIAFACLVSSAAAGPRPPVVVELFTAQGCSSCLKADAVLGELADQADVLPLTFSVGYWDYLGWTDTFAKPAFEVRQRAYARRLALREVYTPQVVVDGRSQAPGAKGEAIRALVAASAALRLNPPDMQMLGERRVAVGSGRAVKGGAEVWLIRYLPGRQEVAIKRGDNRGQTAAHTNVVRQVIRLGAWSGRPVAFTAPAAEEPGLVSLVLLQGAKGGGILGVLAQPAAERPATAQPTSLIKPAASGRRPLPTPGR